MSTMFRTHGHSLPAAPCDVCVKCMKIRSLAVLPCGFGWAVGTIKRKRERGPGHLCGSRPSSGQTRLKAHPGKNGESPVASV